MIMTAYQKILINWENSDRNSIENYLFKYRNLIFFINY